jgi:hypothetical protein
LLDEDLVLEDTGKSNPRKAKVKPCPPKDNIPFKGNIPVAHAPISGDLSDRAPADHQTWADIVKKRRPQNRQLSVLKKGKKR